MDTRVETGPVDGTSLEYPAADAAAIAYNAGPPVVMAKPKIEKQTFSFGKAYVLEDGTRLDISTHYPGTKTIGAYRWANNIDYSLPTTVTSDAPHGAYDHDDNPETASLPLIRAPGDFYPTEECDIDLCDPFTNDNIDEATIKADPVKAGTTIRGVSHGDIYYYDDPDNGRKYWQRILTDPRQGEHMYAGVSVVLNVMGFPVAKPYQYMDFGMWKKIVRKSGEELEFKDMGIGFVHAKPGVGTFTADMPATGTATYEGHYNAAVRQAKADGAGLIYQRQGLSKVEADFAQDTVTVTMTDLATLTGAITNNRFAGTAVSAVKAAAGVTASANGSLYTGSFKGAFYGPMAAEVGGVFDYTSTGKTAGEFRGAFGGGKQPAQ